MILPGTPLRAVLMEHDPGSAEQFIDRLRADGYLVTCFRIDTEHGFEETLGPHIDVVLSDHALPGFDAVRALGVLRKRALDIPLIILSDVTGEEHAVEAIRFGADDYVHKDRLARLGLAIEAAIDRRHMRAKVREATRRAEDLQVRLQRFLDYSPTIMFMKDRAGRYLHVNREFVRAYGLDQVNVIYKTDSEVFPEPYAREMRAHDSEVTRLSKPLRFEEKAPTSSGVRSSIVVRFPLHDSTGDMYGIGGIATDVTERLEIEERYRATFDQATVGIAHVRRDWRFIESNHKLAALLGYSPNELVGMSALDVIHPDDHDESHRVRDLLLQDEHGTSSPERPKRYLRKNGSVVWTRVSTSIVRAKGEPYFATIVQDISDTRAAEQRFRATFEQAAVGIANTSLDRRYVMVNDKFCELTGYTREELLAMRSGDIAHPDDRNAPVTALLLDGSRTTLTNQVRYVRKDGTHIWVDRTVSLVRDDDGKPQYFLRVIQDITARRHAQLALDDTLDQLRSLSRKLMQTQESERRSITRELHDRVGPNLSVLRMSLQMIAKALPPDTRERVADKLHEAEQVLLETIQHTRDIMADLHPPLLDRFGLVAALEEHVAQFTRRTGCDVEVVLHGEKPQPPSIVATACFRVVQEALTNAFKHAQARHLEVTIEGRAGYLKTTVADDGVGFHPDRVRAESRGISVMQERALAVGATFEIETTAGEGARVSFVWQKAP